MPRQSRSFLTYWVARCIHATYFLDRLYAKFDQARSTAVLAFASDAALECHNDVYHGSVRGRLAVRHGLLDWERHAIDTFFPAPPARVLIGGAGMGREAFALAEMGYAVTAFEPVPPLVDEIRAIARKSSASIEVYVGAYQDLPILSGETSTVDLRTGPPFDAAIVGWGSFSQLLADAERVATLRRFAEVTRGPILVSFYGAFSENGTPPGAGRLKQFVRRRAARRGASRFMIRSGYNRLLTAEEIERMGQEAGVGLLELQCRRDAQPYAVFSAAGSRV